MRSQNTKVFSAPAALSQTAPTQIPHAPHAKTHSDAVSRSSSRHSSRIEKLNRNCYRCLFKRLIVRSKQQMQSHRQLQKCCVLAGKTMSVRRPGQTQNRSAIGRVRSGHLWQKRFFSCAMEESHLWSAIRYVELNPVRAGLVPAPGSGQSEAKIV